MHRTNTNTPPPAELLAQQRRSGLTIAAFARERGVAPWKLYTARRRARMKRGAQSDRFAAVTILDSPPPATGFELDLPGHRRLHIPHGFDEAELARLVAVLDGC